ncbi:hypothetical protein BaRGS_00029327 [Batillaria attramentaria]|uniref:Uncharacterized protein n=1 Tax=Batillaria attramentaria TaxID=370345 RepID=A0ABD0JXV6_9CAEN
MVWGGGEDAGEGTEGGGGGGRRLWKKGRKVIRRESRQSQSFPQTSGSSVREVCEASPYRQPVATRTEVGTRRTTGAAEHQYSACPPD